MTDSKIAAGSKVIPIESRWEKTEFGRQKLSVEIDDQGTIRVNTVAQNLFQRFGSALIEFFTFGTLKDYFKDIRENITYTAEGWSKLNEAGHVEARRQLFAVVSSDKPLDQRIAELAPSKIFGMVATINDDVDVYVAEARKTRDPLVNDASKFRLKLENEMNAIVAKASVALGRLLQRAKDKHLQEWDTLKDMLQSTPLEEVNALKTKMSYLQRMDENLLAFLKAHQEHESSLELCLQDGLEGLKQANSLLPSSVQATISNMTYAQFKFLPTLVTLKMKNKGLEALTNQSYIDFLAAHRLVNLLLEGLMRDLPRKKQIATEFESEISHNEGSLAAHIYSNLIDNDHVSSPEKSFDEMTLNELLVQANVWEKECQTANGWKNEIQTVAEQVDAYQELFNEAVEEFSENQQENENTPYLTEEKLQALDLRDISDISSFRESCVRNRANLVNQLETMLDNSRKTNKVRHEMAKELNALLHRIEREKNFITELQQASPDKAFEGISARLDKMAKRLKNFNHVYTIEGWLGAQAKPISELTLEEMEDYKNTVLAEIENDRQELQGISDEISKSIPPFEFGFSEADADVHLSKTNSLIKDYIDQMQSYKKLSPDFSFHAAIDKDIAEAQNLKKEFSKDRFSEMQNHREYVLDQLAKSRGRIHMALLRLYPQGSEQYNAILKVLIVEKQKEIMDCKKYWSVQLIANLNPLNEYFHTTEKWKSKISAQFASKSQEITPYLETYTVNDKGIEERSGTKKPLSALSPQEFISYSHRVNKLIRNFDRLQALAPFNRVLHAATIYEHLQQQFISEMAVRDQLLEQNKVSLAVQLTHTFFTGKYDANFDSTKDMRDYCRGVGDYAARMKSILAKVESEKEKPTPKWSEQMKELEGIYGKKAHTFNEYLALGKQVLIECKIKLIDIAERLKKAYQMMGTQLASNVQYEDDQKAIFQKRKDEIQSMFNSVQNALKKEQGFERDFQLRDFQLALNPNPLLALLFGKVEIPTGVVLEDFQNKVEELSKAIEKVLEFYAKEKILSSKAG